MEAKSNSLLQRVHLADGNVSDTLRLGGLAKPDWQMQLIDTQIYYFIVTLSCKCNKFLV